MTAASLKWHGLSRREMETLGLIAQGYSNNAIADGMFLELKSVKRNITVIYGKLDLASVDSLKRRSRAAQLYLNTDTCARV